MNSLLCVFVTAIAIAIVFSTADAANERVLAKRQAPRSPQRSIPLSRTRQFPPPEELDESDVPEKEEEITTPDSGAPPFRRPVSRFRGRQQADLPEKDDDSSLNEESETTTPVTTTKATSSSGRPSFGRPGSRSRPQIQTPRPSPVTTPKQAPAPPSSSRESSSRARSSFSPRADIGADIVNQAPPSRTQNKPRASSSERQSVIEEPNANPPTRRVGNERVRTRGRQRARSTTTTTTTTTTTAAPPPSEEYYYYYEDEEDSEQKQQATTTTTTTTTKRPASLSRKPAIGRRPGNSRLSPNSREKSPGYVPKFDPESQFEPPLDDVEEDATTARSTRKFTTSTTAAPGVGGIPAHLTSKYRPRTDGRFIDFLRDPNRPRELKGFDLTDYPFYITVPDDIIFECDDKKDGYYASIPHHCQLFHYCFAGSRYDFLCANYTLYDQTTFTCRFANNVDCPSSANYYYRNDDLWKETTTAAPVKTTKKPRARDDDSVVDEEYDDEYDYEEEEEAERRRRTKRRRDRQRKNRTKEEAS